MDRQTAIRIIEKTFPTDHSAPLIAAEGARLFEQARHEAGEWRSAPDHVLSRYAQLCLDRSYTMRLLTERSSRPCSTGNPPVAAPDDREA